MHATPNLPTSIVEFRGFDSSIILILRGGILMSIGDFPEMLSQAILVGIILVGRLGVSPRIEVALQVRENGARTRALTPSLQRFGILWTGTVLPTGCKVGSASIIYRSIDVLIDRSQLISCVFHSTSASQHMHPIRMSADSRKTYACQFRTILLRFCITP